MKVSVLLSVAVGTFVSYAHAANVPDPSLDYNSCLSWANTFSPGTSPFQAAADRCTALQNCNANQSDNAEELRDCVFQAENNYLLASSGESQPQEPSVAPGVSSPIVTETADSYYEQKGGDAKGWENADVGN